MNNKKEAAPEVPVQEQSIKIMLDGKIIAETVINCLSSRDKV